MGEIDHEVGVVDEAGHVDMLEGLEVNFLLIVILAHVAAGFQHGAAEGLLGIAAAFRMTGMDIVVGDEAIAAVGLDEIDQLDDEYRRDGGIGDAVADVHLDSDLLAVHLIGKAGLGQHALEFRGQGLVGVIAAVSHRGKQYIFHFGMPPNRCLSLSGLTLYSISYR